MMGYVYPEAAFRIDGLAPPDAERHHLGGFGFGITLHADFALKCLEAKRPAKQRITRLAGEYITRLFPEALTYGENWEHRAVDWWNDTLLIHGVNVPGNACDLHADRSHIEDWQTHRPITIDPWQWGLEYSPHNVDNVRQAYALLSVWLIWYNCVTATLIVRP